MRESLTMRERTRRAVRAQISAEALTLFEAQGYRQTTIEQIAERSGISVRTFFRYFETKEDVLVGDPADHVEVLTAAFAAQPPEAPIWSALGSALGVIAETSRDPDALRTSALIMSQPQLRARHLEKRARWTEALVPLVAVRLDGPEDERDMRAEALVGAALACFDAAVASWTRSAAVTDLPMLVQRVMRMVHQETYTA